MSLGSIWRRRATVRLWLRQNPDRTWGPSLLDRSNIHVTRIIHAAYTSDDAIIQVDLFRSKKSPFVFELHFRVRTSSVWRLAEVMDKLVPAVKELTPAGFHIEYTVLEPA